MSDQPNQTPPTTVRASKPGGGSKWLLGGVAALILLGGGYFAWKNTTPNQNTMAIAANQSYGDAPLRAGPLARDDAALAESSATTDNRAASSASRAARPARRTLARDVAAEETIGLTPVSAIHESEEIIVPGARRPVWASAPSARRLSALYPERALERGREGEASLHCMVLDNGALDCQRVSETPGFGRAALRVASQLRHAPQRADGSDAAGSPVNLRVVFRIEDENRRG